tara:strand:- start:479 stop:679 length:201 start_codon:yes stop_codon:yes gene_type:complete
MTQKEREELIFDLAQYRISKLSEAGVFAMAVDQMCSLLANETDEQLLKVSLGYSPKQDKNKTPKGF